MGRECLTSSWRSRKHAGSSIGFPTVAALILTLSLGVALFAAETRLTGSASARPLFEWSLTSCAACGLTVDALGGAPSEGSPLRVTVSGTSPMDGEYPEATYKPAAGGTCAATAETDSGTLLGVSSGSPVSAGPFSVSPASEAGIDRGTYLVCAWLEGGGQTPLTGSTTVTVAPLRATIALNFPRRLDAGQAPTVSMVVRLPPGVPVIAFAAIQRGGPGVRCPSDPAGEPPKAQSEFEQPMQGPTGTATNGSEPYKSPLPWAHTLVCAWLEADWNSGRGVVVGPVSTMTTVVAAVSYAGSTSQGFPMTATFGPVQQHLKSIDYGALIRCQRPVLLPSGYSQMFTSEAGFNAAPLARVRVRGGRFSANLRVTSGRRFTLSGRFSGARLSGRFRDLGAAAAYSRVRSERFGCGSGVVAFSLRRRRRG